MERLLSFFNWFIRANATSLSCAVSVADTKLDDLFPFTHSLCQHKIFFLFFRFFHLSYETENQEACEILRQCSQCSPFGNNRSIFIFFFQWILVSSAAALIMTWNDVYANTSNTHFHSNSKYDWRRRAETFCTLFEKQARAYTRKMKNINEASKRKTNKYETK